MSINRNDPQVTAYVLGELGESDRARFEKEISTSEELRRAVAATRRTVEMLTESLSAETCSCLSESQRERLVARMGDESVSKQPAAPIHSAQFERPRIRFRAAMLGALAASVLIACSLAWVRFHALERASQRRNIAKLSTLTHSQQAATNESFREIAGSQPVATDEVAPPAIDSYGIGVYPLPSSAGDSTAHPQTELLGSQGLAHPKVVQTTAEYPVETSQLYRTFAARPDATAGPTVRSVTLSASSAVRIRNSQPSPVALESELANIERQVIPSSDDAPITYPDEKTWKTLTKGRANAENARVLNKAISRDGLSVTLSPEGRGINTDNPAVPGLATSDGGVSDDEALHRAGGRADEGAGPGWSGDRYDPLTDNPFREVTNAPLSTFSIDVDTASYSKTRMYLMEQRMLPPPGAVRIEELINYIDYAYEGPPDGQPFAAHVEVATCPWQPEHRLLRVGIKGKEIGRSHRPTSNLVFLLDVSGSMNHPNKLPLVKRGMQRLVEELRENDQVAIVVYAGAAGLVLPSTGGDQKKTVLDALEQLHAGGSTNGGQGIRLAYQVALDHFVPCGTNRVILCTDGDFNVGTTSTDELVNIVETNAKDGVYLSVLGFGMGNHNDAMLENISNKGNGNYAFIDTDAEARKVLVEQLSGTLVTIAEDVKIQVEFNPARVASYRLIGYANRLLAAEDFNDDKKDAGEIGAGHTVTALYELVPAGAESNVVVPPVDELKYQQPSVPTEAAASGELLTLKLRYKEPGAEKSKLLSFPVEDEDLSFGQATTDFQFAAAVASFGMLLRDSRYKGASNYDAVLEMATSAIGEDKSGYRAEFLAIVARAKELTTP